MIVSLCQKGSKQINKPCLHLESFGAVPGLEAADFEESVAPMEVTVLEALRGPADEAPVDVRPKDCPGWQKPVDDQRQAEAGQGEGEAREWWLGNFRTVNYQAFQPQDLLLTSSGAYFIQWQEWQISDDWSYSTAVGNQMIEVLQEIMGWLALGSRAMAVSGRGPGWAITPPRCPCCLKGPPDISGCLAQDVPTRPGGMAQQPTPEMMRATRFSYMPQGGGKRSQGYERCTTSVLVGPAVSHSPIIMGCWDLPAVRASFD